MLVHGTADGKRKKRLWQNENTVSVVHHCWAQRSMQSWKSMRQMVFNQKIKRRSGLSKWMLVFPEENICWRIMHVEFVEVFSSYQNLIVFFFARLGFRLNLADMFHFFIPSQHPLSAYCWACQEPCESWSKLLNAGVYCRGNNAKANSLYCIKKKKAVMILCNVIATHTKECKLHV